MAKSSKKSSATAAPTSSVSGAPGVESARAIAKSATPVVAKIARKRTGAATRKTPAKPRKSPVAKKPLPAETAISDDEIGLRAYFLAEQRRRDGIAGDSSSDWHEARRQLLAEAAGRA